MSFLKCFVKGGSRNFGFAQRVLGGHRPPLQLGMVDFSICGVIDSKAALTRERNEQNHAFFVAYLSPMNFRQLSPIFGRDIGEKSVPVVGLNDIFGRFRHVLEVVESPFDEDFES